MQGAGSTSMIEKLKVVLTAQAMGLKEVILSM